MKLDILVLVCLCAFQCLALSPNDTAVYYRNSDTGDLWRLAWADEFNDVSHQIDNENWLLEHEAQFCSGNGIGQVSCNTNRTENVRIERGKLVLGAIHEKYYDSEYTAGTVTSRRYFSYGRYEIRATLPVASFVRSTIFTRTEHESYWHENGQIDVMSNTQEAVIYRGIHFANSTSSYKSLDHLFVATGEPIDFSIFHTYGVEWNVTGLRMFIDQRYSAWVKFQDQQNLKPYHQIRLQIGVGGSLVKRGMPEEFAKLAWRCPAFVIDYVRVFELVAGTPLQGLPVVDIAAGNQTNEESDELVKICRGALAFSKKSLWSIQLTSTSIVILSISSFLVLFLAISGYLIYQLKKVKKSVKETDPYGLLHSKSLQGGDNDYNLYEAEMYEAIDYYNDVDKEEAAKISQHAKYNATHNVYLELDATVPVTFGHDCDTRKVGVDEESKATAQDTDPNEGHEYLSLTDHGVR